jgi:predicted transcriptional regulator YheO
MLNQFCSVEGAPVADTLDPAGADAIRQRIDAFATRLASTPRELKTDQRRELMQMLKADGFLEVRRAMEIVAQHLGVSRATVSTMQNDGHARPDDRPIDESHR